MPPSARKTVKKAPVPRVRDRQGAINVILPPDLREKFEAYLASHKVQPKRSGVVIVALGEFLDREFVTKSIKL